MLLFILVSIVAKGRYRTLAKHVNRLIAHIAQGGLTADRLSATHIIVLALLR